MADLNDIDHFVVLMLENRSFDNLFGFLSYPPGVAFDGLRGTESNTDAQGKAHTVHAAPDNPRALWLPDPDPGEAYTDINQQIFGNAAGTGVANMSGFARNYQGLERPGAPDDILHCFAPGEVPALQALARAFAVCDRWFAAAPCQTWPNRFFVHTGTAGGYENNAPTHFPYRMPTVFNAIERQAPDGWTIYFHDFPQSLTLSALWTRLDRFRPFAEFLDNAASGHLPSYSFIEPRYFPDLNWPNDMHPPHNVAYGDQLVADVYNALRASPCWPSTLLVITFDEHGGCYDHVPPPAAPAPEAPQPGQVFAFDRFGVRVPTVVVSPYVAPGTVFRSPLDQPYDHTAIIKTLCRRFGVAAALTARDAGAPDLGGVLTLDAPSNDGPASLAAAPSPPQDDDEALEQARLAPLNDFQSALHDAANLLAPLLHGVTAADHADNLAKGYAPAPIVADNAIDALQSIGNIVGKLLR